MTIGTDHSASSKKRPLDSCQDSHPNKKQKTHNVEHHQNLQLSEEPELPFHKVYDTIIKGCCDSEVDDSSRHSHFFVTFLENSTTNHFALSILHIIFSYPDHWDPLCSCFLKAEEYMGNRECLVNLLKGEYDQQYLLETGNNSELQKQSLHTQRLRFLGNLNGKLLGSLNHYDQEQKDNLRIWFTLLQSLPHNTPAIACLVQDHTKTLNSLLLFKKGFFKTVPWHLRRSIMQINEKLLMMITNIPTGRVYLLSVIKKYVLHPENYEMKYFLRFLYIQRSSLRNCINDSVVGQPWFKKLIKYLPETIEILSEGMVQKPDIQYDTTWKKELRSIMQPRSLRGLETRKQKLILSWSLHFATNIQELWYNLAANKCLTNYLKMLDYKTIRENDELQVKFFENLVMSRLLSYHSYNQLNTQIVDCIQLFPYLTEFYIPNLIFRLSQDILRNSRIVPKSTIQKSFHLPKSYLQYKVKHEYDLMDALLQVLASSEINDSFQKTVTELMKFWDLYSFKQAITFVISFTNRCLKYYRKTKVPHDLLLKFIDQLNDKDMDFFIQVLWDEGLLDEEFGDACMSCNVWLQHHGVAGKLLEAIKRNRDHGEILEALQLKTIYVRIEFE